MSLWPRPPHPSIYDPSNPALMPLLLYLLYLFFGFAHSAANTAVPPSQVPTTSAEWQNLGKLVQLIRTSSFSETFAAEMGFSLSFCPYIYFYICSFSGRCMYACMYSLSVSSNICARIWTVCPKASCIHTHAKHVSQSSRQEG